MEIIKLINNIIIKLTRNSAIADKTHDFKKHRDLETGVRGH